MFSRRAIVKASSWCQRAGRCNSGIIEGTKICNRSGSGLASSSSSSSSSPTSAAGFLSPSRTSSRGDTTPRSSPGATSPSAPFSPMHSSAMVAGDDAAVEHQSRSSATVHPTIESIKSLRKSLGDAASVGFVPTMGALHEGHLSLAREARSKNDVVIASIFVNPAQFAEGEDLDVYPRQMEKDVDLLSEVGVDHVFTPSTDMMYCENFSTYVDPKGFDQTREALSRPTHFRGVATIVTKLFNIIRPTNAYFGQKDAVQCAVIRAMVEDLNMDVSVRVMDTIREDDGLAKSSRNAYLSPEERDAAPVVYKSLCAARELFDSRLARGVEELDANDLLEVVEKVLKSEPLVSEVQYVAVDDRRTMQPREKVGDEGCVISLACIVGKVRLIDNIVLK